MHKENIKITSEACAAIAAGLGTLLKIPRLSSKAENPIIDMHAVTCTTAKIVMITGVFG